MLVESSPSFVTEGGEWVNAHGAARRDVRRDQGDEQQQRASGAEREHVARSRVEKHELPGKHRSQFGGVSSACSQPDARTDSFTPSALPRISSRAARRASSRESPDFTFSATAQEERRMREDSQRVGHLDAELHGPQSRAPFGKLTSLASGRRSSSGSAQGWR